MDRLVVLRLGHDLRRYHPPAEGYKAFNPTRIWPLPPLFARK
jgi:hypothetical protein